MTRTLDRRTAIVMIAVGIVFVALTSGYGAKARVFPLSLSVLMIVAGAGLLVQAWRRGRAMDAFNARRDAAEVPPEADAQPDTGAVWTAAAPLAGVLVVWAVAVSLGAGYLLPSIPMLMAVLWITGERRWSRLIVASVGISLFCFTMFYLLFRTRLPELDVIKDLASPLRRLF